MTTEELIANLTLQQEYWAEEIRRLGLLATIQAPAWMNPNYDRAVKCFDGVTEALVRLRTEIKLNEIM